MYPASYIIYISYFFCLYMLILPFTLLASIFFRITFVIISHYIFLPFGETLLNKISLKMLRRIFARERMTRLLLFVIQSQTRRVTFYTNVLGFSRLQNPFGRVRQRDVTRCTRCRPHKNTHARARARARTVVRALERKHAVPKNSHA